jgi:hypothetical protein
MWSVAVVLSWLLEEVVFTAPTRPAVLGSVRVAVVLPSVSFHSLIHPVRVRSHIGFISIA